MQKELKTRKPKAGLLLIASPRFKNLSGPKRGTYGERKDIAVKEIKATMGFLDLVDPVAPHQVGLDRLFAQMSGFQIRPERRPPFVRGGQRVK